MSTAVAVLAALLFIAEGALVALAPHWVQRTLTAVPARWLAFAGVLEAAGGLGLLYLLAAA